MALDQMLGERALTDVITRRSPLGPAASEELGGTSPEVFQRLYDATNHTHLDTRSDNPSYIVGRKGSGKTAFLIGVALVEKSDVVALKSEHIYTEVNRLRLRYEAVNGPLVADSLVHVWEVLLFHAAMWGMAVSDRLPRSDARRQIWTYMSSFGDPRGLAADELLARVSAHMTASLLDAPQSLSFREACWTIDAERGSFTDAARQAREVAAAAGSRPLYVVVDNLEDLHKHLGTFEDVIGGLFRVVSRSKLTAHADGALPFRTRFAFPAELLPRLRKLAPNPEKDFIDRLIVRWTAPELMVIAGNRLRIFLDHYTNRAWLKLGLPRDHDPKDREAAEATLRAVLPSSEIINGFEQPEDPVGYIMRHTQLLPRHLIEILNEIIGSALVGSKPGVLPEITPDGVKKGVHDAEHVIVEGILSSYSYKFPHLGDALMRMKNHASVVQRASELHQAFNNASAARADMEFEEFMEACLSVGALGVVTSDGPSERYVRGEFSYTFAADVRPAEDEDSVCVHPLFMYRWFDRRAIRRMAADGVRAVYPYGSHPDDDPLA